MMHLIASLLCPICQGEARLLAAVPTTNPAARDRVDLRECAACGHWWHSPMPSQEDLIGLYRDRSAYVVSPDGQESYLRKSRSKDRVSFYSFVLSRVDRANPGGYLEIGAGGGALLQQFQRLGYTCFGVDPAGWVENAAIVPRLEAVPAGMQFKVIALQDVLEHLQDPVDMLRQMRARAQAGARLFCSFPCRDSRPARLNREKWGMIRPYGHLHYFSLASTREVLSRAGWTPLDLKLESVVPLARWVLRGDLKGLAYTLLRGGKDQLYVSAGL
jgi:SAM-dependent methyltransferase